MSLPVGVDTATCTIGRGFDLDGEYADIKVTVTPKFGGQAVRLTWAATGETFESRSKDKGSEPDGDATLSFALPLVDQAGWLDPAGNAITNWYYDIAVSTTFVNGSVKTKMPGYTKRIAPRSSDVSPIDLDKLPDGPPGVPVTVPAPQLPSIVVVVHGNDPNVARPTGATVVAWCGDAEPVHATGYDFRIPATG